MNLFALSPEEFVQTVREYRIRTIIHETITQEFDKDGRAVKRIIKQRRVEIPPEELQ